MSALGGKRTLHPALHALALWLPIVRYTILTITCGEAVMKVDLIGNLLGGAVVGAVALALDYFFLQYFFRTPISMTGGLTMWAVGIYLFVSLVIGIAATAKKA